MPINTKLSVTIDQQLLNWLLNRKDYTRAANQENMQLFMDYCYNPVKNYFIGQFRSYNLPVQVDDVRQEAFIRLQENVDKGKTIKNVRPYFHSICYNVFMEYVKKSFKEREVLVDTEHSCEEYGNDEHVLGEGAGDLFNLVRKKIDSTCVQLLYLFFYRKMKAGEVARELMIKSAENARKKKERCIKQIRTHLNESEL